MRSYSAVFLPGLRWWHSLEEEEEKSEVEKQIKEENEGIMQEKTVLTPLLLIQK